MLSPPGKSAEPAGAVRRMRRPAPHLLKRPRARSSPPQPGASIPHDSVFVARLRIIRRVEIASVGRAVPADVNNRSICSAGKVVHSAWFRVQASGRKQRPRALLKMRAVCKLPVAGNYCRHAIVAMRVGLNRRVRGHEQQDGIKAGAGWLPAKILVCTRATFELPIWLSPGCPLTISAAVMRMGGGEGAVAPEPTVRIATAQPSVVFIAHRSRARAGHRNATRASIVSLGRSSMSQWPVSFSSTTFTSVATSFI